IHCSLPQSKAREINEGRPDKYSEDVFNELVMRYEEPNSANRWDHPLFTVLQHLEGEKLPFEQIWGALVESRAPPPNLSTAVQPVTPTNFLHEMDQITKDIIDHVFSILQSGVQVSEVSVPRTSKKITRPITFQELKRYRAQFIKINRLHRLGLASIADLFVDYLNANIE
ncbi:kti12, chromatin associated, partial [Spiromyces aspiralis]